MGNCYGQTDHSPTAPIKGRACQVTQDPYNFITTQLLVTKSHLEMLFQVAHANPIVGYLGLVW